MEARINCSREYKTKIDLYLINEMSIVVCSMLAVHGCIHVFIHLVGVEVDEKFLLVI